MTVESGEVQEERRPNLEKGGARGKPRNKARRKEEVGRRLAERQEITQGGG